MKCPRCGNELIPTPTVFDSNFKGLPHRVEYFYLCRKCLRKDEECFWFAFLNNIVYGFHIRQTWKRFKKVNLKEKVIFT